MPSESRSESGSEKFEEAPPDPHRRSGFDGSAGVRDSPRGPSSPPKNVESRRKTDKHPPAPKSPGVKPDKDSGSSR
jgi:hypothetical protein